MIGRIFDSLNSMRITSVLGFIFQKAFRVAQADQMSQLYPFRGGYRGKPCEVLHNGYESSNHALSLVKHYQETLFATPGFGAVL